MASHLCGLPLYELALLVLNEPDFERKASLTHEIHALYFSSEGIPLEDTVGTPFDAATRVPACPARPPTVSQVSPKLVKNSSKKHTLHALCHAESYAIDLSWDIIARFGWSKTTWGPYADHLPGSHLPKEFFDDWVKVADEEATHFTRWLTRLRELGATYGDYPAHGMLWESAEDTAHSLAARLAIVHCVHEGRGLDVAAALYAKLASDPQSQLILTMNLEEEVSHVAAGVKWFSHLAQHCEEGVVPHFHAQVRKHFHGALRPPFDEVRRGEAGMAPEWYLPLCAPPHGEKGGVGGGGPAAAVTLTQKKLEEVEGELAEEDIIHA